MRGHSAGTGFPAFRRELPQARQTRLAQPVHAHANWVPGIPVLDGTPQGRLARATDPNGRVGRPHGPWRGMDVLKGHIPSCEGRHLVGLEGFDGGQVFIGDGPTPVEGHAQDGKFLRRPAYPHSKEESPATQLVHVRCHARYCTVHWQAKRYLHPHPCGSSSSGAACGADATGALKSGGVATHRGGGPHAVATAQVVHDRYKDLALVEQAFRTCQTTHWELRPWYVRSLSVACPSPVGSHSAYWRQSVCSYRTSSLSGRDL